MFSILLEKMHPRKTDNLQLQYRTEKYRDTLCPLLGKIFGEAVECSSLKVSPLLL
jgi:hypothetical protein